MAFTPAEEVLGSAPKRSSFTPFDDAQASLATSQSLLDNAFYNPQKNILEGKTGQPSGFETPLTRLDPTGKQSEAMIKNAPTTAGAVLGGIGGAALGSAAGPVGTYAGGVAGTTAGAALGEGIRQKATGAVVNPAEAAKTGLEFGALEAIGGPLASGLGKLIKGAGKGLAKAVIPKSSEEAGRLLRFRAENPLLSRIKSALLGQKTPIAEPITSAETAFQKGIMGPESMVGVQAKRESKNLWENVISPKLKASKAQVDMPKFFDDVEKQIVKENPEPTRQKDLLEALQSMREDYAGTSKATTEQIQQFKEGWAKFIPDKTYRGKPIAGPFRDVQNTAAGKAREFLYKELGPEGKQAYIDYGNLKSLEELGQKAIQEGTVPVGGTATLLNHLLQKVAVPVGTIGGQTIYKVGEGIELIGKPGARTVRDVVGTLGGVGRETVEDTSTFSPYQ